MKFLFLALFMSFNLFAEEKKCRAIMSTYEKVDSFAQAMELKGYEILRIDTEEEIQNVARPGDFVFQLEYGFSRAWFSPFTAFTECTISTKIVRMREDQKFYHYYSLGRFSLDKRINRMKFKCEQATQRLLGEMHACDKVLAGKDYPRAFIDYEVNMSKLEDFHLYWHRYY